MEMLNISPSTALGIDPIGTLVNPTESQEGDEAVVHDGTAVDSPAAAAPDTTPEGTPGPPAFIPATYPPATATHEQVCADANLFHETLKDLWNVLGVPTEKVPRVGGKELDLHLLYVKVTELGGCERVISRKQWREAAEPFHYPPTITSVSFTLRKAYVMFLWDYEQVYFFRNTGPRVEPPFQKQSAPDRGEDLEYSSSAYKRLRVDTPITEYPPLNPMAPTSLVASAMYPGEPHYSMVGTRGTVNVDAKFDCGFFVTVRLAKQEFRGILYYPPSPGGLRVKSEGVPGAGTPYVSPPMGVTSNGDALNEQDNGLRRGKRPLGGDPYYPRPNRTPFSFFAMDARTRGRQLNPAISQGDLNRKVSDMWQKASDYEKGPYIELANHDRIRYQADLEAYNFRLAAGFSQTSALRAQQAVVKATTVLSEHPPISLQLFVDVGIITEEAAQEEMARRQEAAAREEATNPQQTEALAPAVQEAVEQQAPLEGAHQEAVPTFEGATAANEEAATGGSDMMVSGMGGETLPKGLAIEAKTEEHQVPSFNLGGIDIGQVHGGAVLMSAAHLAGMPIYSLQTPVMEISQPPVLGLSQPLSMEAPEPQVVELTPLQVSEAPEVQDMEVPQQPAMEFKSEDVTMNDAPMPELQDAPQLDQEPLAQEEVTVQQHEGVVPISLPEAGQPDFT